MKIEVEIGKKYFIGIVAVMLIIAGTFFVVSYNSVPANPAVFGHSADEIEGLSDMISSSVDLCVCIQFYTYWDYYRGAPIQCAPLGSWSAMSGHLQNGFGMGSRVAIVQANADGSCTPPA